VAPKGYLPPVSDAGSDLSAAELSAVTLDGSRSASPSGRAITYAWRQISGPPARSIDGGATARPTVTLPSVDGDQALIFDLLVSDGLARATDRVQVTAIDLALRKASVSLVGSSQPSPMPGSRALVFSADLKWAAAVED